MKNEVLLKCPDCKELIVPDYLYGEKRPDLFFCKCFGRTWHSWERIDSLWYKWAMRKGVGTWTTRLRKFPCPTNSNPSRRDHRL